MERNIRDVRDIFGRGDSRTDQELRSYEYSPRSRRRQEAMENYDPRQQQKAPLNSTQPKKTSRHSRTSDDLKAKEEEHKTSRKDKADKNKKDAAFYANRTLTERDIRHLERHLSMKKTIRKQISRNLQQAFVDDPEMVLANIPLTKETSKSSSNKTSADKTFTLTRAKVSKSEQNVLDLLKDNEPDSGHCSADNPSDDDMQEQKQIAKANENLSTQKDNLMPETRAKQDQTAFKDEGKFSFWKMFSVKNRGRR